MRWRVPDIKKVDEVYETFSDFETFKKRMGEMRKIRDEIKAASGVYDTKEKAARLLTQAQSANAAATSLMNDAVSEKKTGVAAVKKARDAFAKKSSEDTAANEKAEKALGVREAELNKKGSDFDASMVKRENAVTKREGDVGRREEVATQRENALNDWAATMKEASAPRPV